MASPPPRLDGWKAIAAYLGRDERTAQRWRERGLPVHFVPGGRRGTVVAFTAEIDEWLGQHPPGGHPDNGHDRPEAPPPHAASPASPLPDRVGEAAGIPDSPAPTTSVPHAPAGPARDPRHRGLKVAAVLTLAAAVAAAVAFRAASGNGADQASPIARAEVSQHGLLAWTLDGRVAFAVPLNDLMPVGEDAMPPGVVVHGVTTIADLDGDGLDEVMVTLSYAAGRRVLSDEVRAYAADGTLRWQYQPHRALRFGDRTFDGPWAVTSQLVVPDEGGRSRVVLAVYHDIWWPSFLVSLDAEGHELLHFVHSGHLYALQLAPTPAGNLVLAAGINNEYKCAMLAAVDLREAPAVSPQADPTFSCANCAPEWLASPPAAYVLFPQTEASQRLGHPYNRGHRLGVSTQGVELGVREMPQLDGRGEIFSHYRLSPQLEPVARWMSDGYWQAHRQLEARGNVDHPVTECPERKGMSARIWTGTGWREVWVPTEGASE